MTPEQFKLKLSFLGLGQTELAHMMGLSDRTIRHYILGDRKVPQPLIKWLEYFEEREEAMIWLRKKATISELAPPKN